jgi:hypothetical protein
MKKALIYVILVVVIGSIAASCSGSNRTRSGKNCGCNLNKGFVGY